MSAAPPITDLNAETYPFDVVQENLDRTAFFHLHSAPAAPPETAGNDGWRIRERLYRFETTLEPPASPPVVRATNLVGEALATFEHRWKFIPYDWAARPGEDPPGEPWQPSTSQRFAVLESECRFDSGDGFEGFATGTTTPCPPGPSSRIGIVGTIIKGYGRFYGLTGTYTYVGSFDPFCGFRGSVMIRVVDPRGVFGDAPNLPELSRAAILEESGVTYLLFRGQKRDRNQKTTLLRGDDGAITGLSVEQPIRLMYVACAHGSRGLRSSSEVGQIIGSMLSRVTIDLSNASGPSTNETPTPFVASNVFTFFDSRGNPFGSVETSGGEGRSFQLLLDGIPRQPALRFGAVQPVTGGTGCFAGVSGLLADNSATGIAPHVLATLYVLRLDDPHHRFRTEARGR